MSKKQKPQKSRVPKELAKSREINKTIQKNAKKPKQFYKNVGLVEDPNKTIGKKSNVKPKQSKMVQDLEEAANRERKKKFKFGKEMVKEITYYIAKYSDDYDAMARDKRNIYQDSAGQLRAKIKKYLAIEARKK